MHTTFLKGRTATKDQQAGLAIFDTSRIRAMHVSIWRVEDLLTFFDSKRDFLSSMKVDRWAREWARNSNEYLCWNFISTDALAKFIPYERLGLRSDSSDDNFLRPEFIDASSLGDFRKRFSSSSELLTVDQYQCRVSSIVIELTDHVNPVKDIDSFVKAIVNCFLNSALWGYKLKERIEMLGPLLRRINAAKYALKVIKRDDIETG